MSEPSFFSPDKLHRTLHDIARAALDVGEALAIIEARAAARLRTIQLRAEAFDLPAAACATEVVTSGSPSYDGCPDCGEIYCECDPPEVA